MYADLCSLLMRISLLYTYSDAVVENGRDLILTKDAFTAKPCEFMSGSGVTISNEADTARIELPTEC